MVISKTTHITINSKPRRFWPKEIVLKEACTHSNMTKVKKAL